MNKNELATITIVKLILRALISSIFSELCLTDDFKNVKIYKFILFSNEALVTVTANNYFIIMQPYTSNQTWGILNQWINNKSTLTSA